MVPNAKLRELKLRVDPSDKRRVEFAVYGLQLFHGVPILLDCSQVSPLKVVGTPHRKCASRAGVALRTAERRKDATYWEAAASQGTVRLLTLACEVGGRWSDTCVAFVRTLAKHKAEEAPPLMRRSAEYAWLSRWWSILSCAAQGSFAASITEADAAMMQPASDSPPTLESVMEGSHDEGASLFSRLPLRG